MGMREPLVTVLCLHHLRTSIVFSTHLLRLEATYGYTKFTMVLQKFQSDFHLHNSTVHTL